MMLSLPTMAARFFLLAVVSVSSTVGSGMASNYASHRLAAVS